MTASYFEILEILIRDWLKKSICTQKKRSPPSRLLRIIGHHLRNGEGSKMREKDKDKGTLIDKWSQVNELQQNDRIGRLNTHGSTWYLHLLSFTCHEELLINI